MISLSLMPTLLQPVYVMIDYEVNDNINMIISIGEIKMLVETSLCEIKQIRNIVRSMNKTNAFKKYIEIDDMIEREQSNLIKSRNDLIIYNVLKEVLYNEEITVFFKQ
jgi:hypothetical protein